MNAFITGSRVYGTPAEDSDIDLVVLMSEDDKAEIRAIHGHGPVKFGNLNLILCDQQEQYDCWKKSKEDCSQKAWEQCGPLTRAEAVTIHIENRVNAFGASKEEPTRLFEF